MVKISDINEAERDRAKVDSKGRVLCLHCEKNLAKISEYGMLRKCTKCEGKIFGPSIFIDETNGMRNY